MNSLNIESEPEFRAWVAENSAADPSELRLKYSHRKGPIDYSFAITQIECRRRFGRKLAETLSLDPGFIFPGTLAGEQCSSDLAAGFHTSLALSLQPEKGTAIDLTAGLGIDAMHLARAGFRVTAVEQNPETTAALAYNAGLLNIEVLCGDCINILRTLPDSLPCKPSNTPAFDIAFIDPARRGTEGQRLFSLSDCHPDVVALMPLLLRTARHVIVKASPMLDITEVSRLISPSHIYITGTATECKEVVAVCGVPCGNPLISAVMLGTETAEFTYDAESDRRLPLPALCTPEAGAYVCDPAPALLKAGAIRSVAHRYNLGMFDYNARLFCSTSVPDGFMGRVSRILEVVPYSSSNIKRLSRRYPKINVTARNFGINAEQLSAKLKVRTGGDLRLYAVPSPSGPVMLICKED